MSTSISMKEAQAQLPELIARLSEGETIVITQDQKPVARLIREPSMTRKPRKAGSAKGKLIILQEDEEHLRDFEEYM